MQPEPAVPLAEGGSQGVPGGAPLHRLQIFNHQDRQPVREDCWQDLASQALPLALAQAKTLDAPLHRLHEVEISLVSDETIARVHDDFMADPAPTDVITFHHGEILISLDTAKRQAAENAETYEREVTRYIVHGLLHLAGWDDQEEVDRAAMHRVQEAILSAISAADPAAKPTPW